MRELEVVCGAILHEGKYLIAKRGKGVDEGFWEFPGGKMEPNETQQQAIIRELKEELEIDVKVIKYLCSVDDIRENLIIHVHAYLCEIVNGQLYLNNHDEVLFVNKEDLYNYNFQKADKDILDILNK